MPLFQIAEPSINKLAVGIDLGTTRSLVAVLTDGSVKTLVDPKSGSVFLDSVAYYGNEKPVVGSDAWELSQNNPMSLVTSVKRLMGRTYLEVSKNYFPYDLVDEPGMVRIKTRTRTLSPVEVSADILRALRDRAQADLKRSISDAVITVPAYFDDAQRQATKDAAALAGFNVQRLLNEPTAAAIAYGLERDISGTYLVYDLGGGTFDVSILKLEHAVFQVIATAGDTHLGGDDFDNRIVQWIKEKFLQSGRLIEDWNPSLIRSFLLQAKRIKELLSVQDEVTEIIPYLNQPITLTRELFESITSDLLNRSTQVVEHALRDAQLSVVDLDGVILVGGATRMPQILSFVRQFFGREPLKSIDPDQVVALGAAMQASRLARDSESGTIQGKDWLLLDVTPLSLGIETFGGLTECIIPRNTTLPATKSRDFTTAQAEQTAIVVHVIQGERPLAEQCRSLARFELRIVPNIGQVRVRVTFHVDTNGVLSVHARDLSTGSESEILVKPSYGLDPSEIQEMLERSRASSEDDAIFRNHQEQKIVSAKIAEQVRRALAEDGTLLSADQFSEISACLEALESLMKGGKASVSHPQTIQLKRQTDILVSKTAIFAEKRMDKAVSDALKGF